MGTGQSMYGVYRTRLSSVGEFVNETSMSLSLLSQSDYVYQALT